MNTILQGALDLAAKGYKVLPCGLNKQPSVEGGFYAADTDPDKIRAWADAGRLKAVAVATGYVNSLAVADADNQETLEKLRAKYGREDVKTRRGGHFWFAHPGDGKIESGPIGDQLGGKCDMKADPGYVIVPPSSGKEWTNGIPDIDSLPVLPKELRPKRTKDTSEPEFLSEEIFAAAVEVLAENYPEPGERYEAGLPLAGFLLNNGVGWDDAYNVVMEALDRQPEGIDRDAEKNVAGVIHSTHEKIKNGEPVTGGPTLDTFVPGLSKKLAEALQLDKTAEATEADKERLRQKAADEAWERCDGLAKSDDITAHFANTLHASGVAGESKQIRLLYLALVSRFLNRMVSLAGWGWRKYDRASVRIDSVGTEVVPEPTRRTPLTGEPLPPLP